MHQTRLRIPNAEKIEAEFFEENFKGTLQALINEYNSADNFDRLSKIDHKMSIANRQVEEATIKALDNGEDVKAALERSERLVDGGEDFKAHAELAKEENAAMNTRKLLFLLIVFAVVVGIAVLIGYLK